jgi:hypothetical protein
MQQKVTNEEEKENHKGEEEEAKAADLDYLSPFLVNYVITKTFFEPFL